MRAPRFAENLFAALFRLDLEARGFAKKPMHLFSARFASASGRRKMHLFYMVCVGECGRQKMFHPFSTRFARFASRGVLAKKPFHLFSTRCASAGARTKTFPPFQHASGECAGKKSFPPFFDTILPASARKQTFPPFLT